MENDLQLICTLSRSDLITIHEWNPVPLEPILEPLIRKDMEELE